MNTEAANRCRHWLEEQLDQLRGLRNGNPRDAQFKQWRQTTLTVLQRIWSADSTRSERFRRIRFSSPQSRVDAKTVADWFTRGCDEAASQLTALIAEIDREGVPATALPAVEAHDPETHGAEEAAFPTLDLSRSQGGSSVEIPGDRDIVLDLGGPSASSTPAAPGRDERDDPAPPTLRVSVPARAPRSNAAKSTASRPAPPPARAPEAAPAPAARASEAPRSRGARRSSGKGRLRDLLGLDDVIARVREEDPKPEAAEAPPARAPEAAAPTPKAAAPAPKPPAPAPEAVVVPPAAAEVVASAAPAVEIAPEAADAPPAHGDHAAEPTPTPEPEFTKAAVDDALARMTVRPRAAAPAPPPAPVQEVEAPAEPAPALEPVEAHVEPSPTMPVVERDAGDAPVEEVVDEGEFEEATQRFLETSPVLSLTGRPVHRRTDVTRFEHPDAVALATLAEDAARLGVPDDRREAVKSQLGELAQRFESGDPDWHLIAEVAREAMLHRPLAERLMPVLLPWLSRAA